MSGPARGYLSRLEEAIDRISYRVNAKLDVVGEEATDVKSSVIEVAFRFLGTAFVTLVNSLVPKGDPSSQQFLRQVMRIAALGFVAVFGLILMISFVLLGTVQSLLGLRRGRAYSLRENLVAWLPLIVIAVAAPLLIKTDFKLGQVTLFLAYTIIVLGLNIVVGFAGQASFGHGAFVLLGGYIAMIFRMGAVFGMQVPATPSLLLGGLGAALIGMLIGLPAVKVHGPYLALLTLGLMLSVAPILKHPSLRGLTGGVTGLSFEAMNPPEFLSGLSPGVWLYLHALMFFVLAHVVVHVLMRRSKIGRALASIKDGEERTSVLGINIAKYKMLAFGFSAFYAGVGGALLAFQTSYISPESISMSDSLDYLVALVLGGRSSLLGSAIGGLFITYRPFVASWLAKSIVNGDQLLGAVNGISLIFVMVIAPRGIAGQLHQWLFKRSFRMPPRRKYRRQISADYDIEEEEDVIGKILWLDDGIKIVQESRLSSHLLKVEPRAGHDEQSRAETRFHR